MAKTTPRGIRNNNPLNIRYNPRNNWVGQTGNDGQFCVFSASKYGIRAAVKILQKYAGNDGKITIFEIINKWAPRTDGNNTEMYIEKVCHAMCLRETDTIDVHQRYTVVLLFWFMAIVECTSKALQASNINIYDFILGFNLANENEKE